MNEAQIRALAEQHRSTLVGAKQQAAARTGPTFAEIFDREIGPLMERLDAGAQRFCATYNEAFGSTKLIADNDPHGINVQSAADSENAARLHVDLKGRTVARCLFEFGFSRGEKLPLTFGERAGRLTLVLDGQPIDEAALMATLLERFTTALTETEAAAL